MTITEFREHVVMGMIDRANVATHQTPIPMTPSSTSVKHHLVANMVNGIKKKTRCSEYYKKYGRQGRTIDGKLKKAAQVVTKCSACNISICKNCINERH